MSRRRYALLALVAMALAGAALIGSRFDLSEDGARTTARRWWPFHSENTEPVIAPPEAGASSTILGTARLHDVYSRLQNSVDPAERSIAWHIWSLCVPSYVTPRDQSPDAPPAYTAGLANDALRALRVAARRRIADQCQEFSDTTRDRLRDEDFFRLDDFFAVDFFREDDFFAVDFFRVEDFFAVDFFRVEDFFAALVAAVAAAMVLLFVLCVLLGNLTQKLGASFISNSGLTGVDRLLGMAFGAARGGVVAVVLLIAVRPFFGNTAWWHASRLIPVLLRFEDVVLRGLQSFTTRVTGLMG